MTINDTSARKAIALCDRAAHFETVARDVGKQGARIAGRRGSDLREIDFGRSFGDMRLRDEMKVLLMSAAARLRDEARALGVDSVSTEGEG